MYQLCGWYMGICRIASLVRFLFTFSVLDGFTLFSCFSFAMDLFQYLAFHFVACFDFLFRNDGHERNFVCDCTIWLFHFNNLSFQVCLQQVLLFKGMVVVSWAEESRNSVVGRLEMEDAVVLSVECTYGLCMVCMIYIPYIPYMCWLWLMSICI